MNEKKAENTPAGGVLVGKKDGQTIIHDEGTMSGYLVGKLHKDGGIKAVNKATGQPLEMQGGEVVITAPAVSDQTKREFEGKMMTNREILSAINEKGGGVSFAEGGEVPERFTPSGASYNYGGKTMTDHEILNAMNGSGHLSKGKSLKQIAQMHNVSLTHINEELAKGLEVEKEHFADFKERTRVAKDHLVENPNYYTILAKAGLKMGGHIQRQELVNKSKKGDSPARDLNNYNDLMDLEADGAVGGDNGLAFAKGGVVYDTTKPKIEKVTIKQTRFDGNSAIYSGSRQNIIGRVANNVSELQQIVSDYIGNMPKEDYDYIQFYVNDGAKGNYYIELNKGKKNTVKNVNPETINSVNFKRVIDAKSYLVKNYDWTDFFGGATNKPTLNKLLIKNIVVVYKNRISADYEYKNTKNPIELLNFLRGLTNGDYEDITLQPLDENNLSQMPKHFDVTSQTWKDILKQDDVKAEAELMSVLQFGEFPDSDFTEFIKEGKATSKNQTDKIYEFTVSAKLGGSGFEDDKVQNINELFLALDKRKSWNSTILLKYKDLKGKIKDFGIYFTNDPSNYYELNKNNFTIDYLKGKLKEWFPNQIEDFLKSNSNSTISTTVSTSVKPFDFTLTKIDVSNNPKLSLGVQKRAFELGWEWENNGGKTLDYNTFNYLYFTKTSISYGNTKSSFDNSPKREITEEDIFGIKNANNPIINQNNIEKVNYVIFEFKNNANGIIRRKIKNSAMLLEALKEGQNAKYRDAEILVNGINSPKSIAWLFLDQTYPVYDWRGKDLSTFEYILTTNLIDGKYDWNDFLVTKRNTKSKIDDEVQSVLITYGVGQQYVALNEEKLLDKIKEIWKDGGRSKMDIQLQPQGNITSLSNPVIVTLDTIRTNIFNLQASSLSLSELKEYLSEDWYSELNFEYFFKTPPVVKSGSVQEINNLKEAVGVLEGIASQASQKYNTKKYEESLELLKEVKEEYSLALSFTPESSFMYERIELMKKITEIQKEITRITELKNGGAFYILSKVIDRLERGENWKELGKGEIMVNEVPQQEIDAVIYTEKFKNWFGDWEQALITKEYDYVSKAITESGKPCVMYHGAKRIKYSYRQVSNGVVYLAENRSYAEWFSATDSPYQKQGDYLTQCFVNLKNPIDLTPFGVEEVDLRDIIQYIDALYPLAKIYDVLPPNVAMAIMNNQLIGRNFRAWYIIRQFPELNKHIRDNTTYDGFIYYENNPSDIILSESGEMIENVTKATAVFNSNQVKLVDAMLFDGSLDDWRFETGGKVN